MSPATRAAILLAVALPPAAGGAATGAGEPPSVGVIPVAGGAAAVAWARAAEDAAARAGAAVIVSESVLRAVAAPGRDAARCASDPACVVSACAAVQADVLLAVAGAPDANGGVRLEVRALDCKRGRLRGQTGESVRRDDALEREAVARLATRVLQPVLFSGALPVPGAVATGTGVPLAPPPLTRAPGAPMASVPLPPPPPGMSVRPTGPTPPPLAAAPAKASPEAGVADRPDARRRWGTLLAGAGAALLTGGAVTGAVAWSTSRDAQWALARGDTAGFVSRSRGAQRLGWGAAAVGGAGAAALAAGAWLHLGSGSSRVAVGVEPGLAGARVAVAF